jgi:hypothetical protein
MTIAHIRKKTNTTPNQFVYSKEDMSHIAKLVPDFAARWHLFCKYFYTPEINNKMIQTEATIVYRYHPFTP